MADNPNRHPFETSGLGKKKSLREIRYRSTWVGNPEYPIDTSGHQQASDSPTKKQKPSRDKLPTQESSIKPLELSCEVLPALTGEKTQQINSNHKDYMQLKKYYQSLSDKSTPEYQKAVGDLTNCQNSLVNKLSEYHALLTQALKEREVTIPQVLQSISDDQSQYEKLKEELNTLKHQISQTIELNKDKTLRKNLEESYASMLKKQVKINGKLESRERSIKEKENYCSRLQDEITTLQTQENQTQGLLSQIKKEQQDTTSALSSGHQKTDRVTLPDMEQITQALPVTQSDTNQTIAIDRSNQLFGDHNPALDLCQEGDPMGFVNLEGDMVDSNLGEANMLLARHEYDWEALWKEYELREDRLDTSQNFLELDNLYNPYELSNNLTDFVDLSGASEYREASRSPSREYDANSDMSNGEHREASRSPLRGQDASNDMSDAEVFSGEHREASLSPSRGHDTDDDMSDGEHREASLSSSREHDSDDGIADDQKSSGKRGEQPHSPSRPYDSDLSMVDNQLPSPSDDHKSDEDISSREASLPPSIPAFGRHKRIGDDDQRDDASVSDTSSLSEAPSWLMHLDEEASKDFVAAPSRQDISLQKQNEKEKAPEDLGNIFDTGSPLTEVSSPLSGFRGDSPSPDSEDIPLVKRAFSFTEHPLLQLYECTPSDSKIDINEHSYEEVLKSLNQTDGKLTRNDIESYFQLMREVYYKQKVLDHLQNHPDQEDEALRATVQFLKEDLIDENIQVKTSFGTFPKETTHIMKREIYPNHPSKGIIDDITIYITNNALITEEKLNISEGAIRRNTTSPSRKILEYNENNEVDALLSPIGKNNPLSRLNGKNIYINFYPYRTSALQDLSIWYDRSEKCVYISNTDAGASILSGRNDRFFSNKRYDFKNDQKVDDGKFKYY